jgi:hypothetical protein
VLALVGAAPVEMTDGEVTDGLLELITLAGQVQAAVARFADSFDSRCLATVDGARSTAGWVAARTELGRPTVSGAVATGRGLRHCPVVDEAAARGRLGSAKVRLLLDAREGVEDLFRDHEAHLVADVVPLTVDQARRAIDDWRRVALATVGKDDGPAPADDVDGNAFHLSPTFQGRWRLDGDLDSFTGTGLDRALDQWIDARVREGLLDPTDRKRSSLRAEALAALVGLGTQTGSSRTQPRARVAISWDAADLLGRPVADLAELAHRRCVTDRGTSLSRLAADQALCNADVIDLLTVFGLDGSRTVLGVTHTRRHPTARERAALAERDRGCVFPGCDAPVHWCDAHHNVPYEIGHRTRLDELVLLCPHHHRQVHRGFTLARSATGHIHVARPDGTRLSPEPPGVASRPDPRHKLPPPPTRFAARLGRSGPPPTPDPEPFDPVYEAEVDARIHQRFRDLPPRRAA